jgi:hypothetical protein
MRHVVMAIAGAALVISPSFLASIMVSRGRMGIGTVAIVSLALFLVGAYLLVTLFKE